MPGVCMRVTPSASSGTAKQLMPRYPSDPGSRA